MYELKFTYTCISVLFNTGWLFTVRSNYTNHGCPDEFSYEVCNTKRMS